jgi:hypothetical protein
LILLLTLSFILNFHHHHHHLFFLFFYFKIAVSTIAAWKSERVKQAW